MARRHWLINFILMQAFPENNEGNVWSDGCSTKSSINTKPTCATLYYEVDPSNGEEESEKNAFIINMIDPPGYLDHPTGVSGAYRIIDGVIVVVDFSEGVRLQTETMLRQALAEKVKPVLMINKVDKGIIGLEAEGEDLYQQFLRIIESINTIISPYENLPNIDIQNTNVLPERDEEKKEEFKYQTAVFGELKVDPTKGTIAFGSGLQGWAFTLSKFARIYSKKFKVDQDKMMEKLWGDNYFDAKAKKWKKHSTADDGETLSRCFVQFIMDPVIRLANAIRTNNKDRVWSMLKALNIPIKEADKEEQSESLLTLVFQRWLSATDALLEMVVLTLPSPAAAQRYRVADLYEGPLDDECACAIRECDPAGPLMVFISRMVPADEEGRFYAFGRVFSGTVRSGEEVRIMGPKYTPGGRDDLHIKDVEGVVLMSGAQIVNVSDVPCGNTVGLTGIDQFLMKQGTLSTSMEAHKIRSLKWSASPLVKVNVEPKNASDLPALLEGLKRLAKSDPFINMFDSFVETHGFWGMDILHVENWWKALEQVHVTVPITVSGPFITYKETIAIEGKSEGWFVKSPNRRNTFTFESMQLGTELVNEIESQNCTLGTDNKIWSSILVDEYGWNVKECENLWLFGPGNFGPNAFVDATENVEFKVKAKNAMGAAFQWVTEEAPLTAENMRGVRFNAIDAVFFKERGYPLAGMGQLVPAFRKAMFAAYLSGKPRLQEPIFLIEIQTTEEAIEGSHNVLLQRRGEYIGEQAIIGTSLKIIKAYLPVVESFGFTEHLRTETSGRALTHYVFDHWEVLDSDPYEEGSTSNNIVKDIRKRKGLKEEFPKPEDYISRM